MNLSRTQKQTKEMKELRLKPARSLSYFLSEQHVVDAEAAHSLHVALILSIRIAAELNDYILILNLMKSIRSYDTIKPQILGEAIRGLTQTSASCSKIINVWKQTNIPYGTREVNAMLAAYQKHRKVSASLALYRDHVSLMDAYSLCTVFNTLKESIRLNQAPVERSNSVTREWNRSILYDMAEQSPCWQWHEALSLLDDFSMEDDDTNVVSSHLLQLNERITELFPQHNGRYMARCIRDAICGNAVDAITVNLLIRGMNHWKDAIPLAELFPDNKYVCSSAISVCGRRFDLAMEHFLSQYTGTHSTEVSNAFLQTCVGRNRGTERLRMALDFVDRMAQRDTITWNTLLAVVVATRRTVKQRDWETLCEEYPDWFQGDETPYSDRLVRTILLNANTADSVTFKHAIQAIDVYELASILKKEVPREYRSLDLYNQALELASKGQDLDLCLRILSMMQNIDHISCNEDSKTHIIRALGSDPRSSLDLSTIVLGTTNPSCWVMDQATLHEVNLQACLTPLEPQHWSVAIEACLLAGDFDGARLLLRKTRLDEFQVKDIERLASAYAEIALQSDPSKAANAYKILSTLKEPSVGLRKQVIRACFRAELWVEARELLHNLHQHILYRPGEKVTRSNALGGLHRELLKSCSQKGNLVVALSLCQDIQSISKQLLKSNATTKVEMGAMEWKYFIATAAKAGNWKVCLSTLQHLQSPLKAANPTLQSKSPDALRSQYAKFESTLDHVVRCFAKNKQFAWIIRVVDDWIDWSGRPPPLSATRTAIRYLAQPEHISEFNGLIGKVMSMKTSTYAMDPELYRGLVYISAISALYSNGLYDAADDQFVNGVAEGAIPFQVSVDDNDHSKRRISLDLHGMNLAVAHSAVRIAIQREAAYVNDTSSKPIELMIITGKGMNSKIPLRPILRPAVQRMLVEEFYPPLGTTTQPGNIGALVISPKDIAAWIDHQYQQRGVRMLLVAAMLKTLAVKVVSQVSNLSDGGD